MFIYFFFFLPEDFALLQKDQSQATQTGCFSEGKKSKLWNVREKYFGFFFPPSAVSGMKQYKLRMERVGCSYQIPSRQEKAFLRELFLWLSLSETKLSS